MELTAIEKLESEKHELLEKLKEVHEWIKNHDEWWIGSPDKGGFDNDSIEQLIKRSTNAK